jgi:hypothetical protein
MGEEDWESANTMLGFLYRENCLDERERAQCEAEKILREKWYLVERVVEALLEKITISGYDVSYLCEG